MAGETDELEAMKAVLVVVGFLIALPLQVVVHGWALWALWGWFAEPLSGVVLGYWHAAGVMVALNYLRRPWLPKDDGEPFRKTLARGLGGMLFYVPLVVLTGWIVQGLMP